MTAIICLGGCQCLGQVGDQVVRVLQADGKADGRLSLIKGCNLQHFVGHVTWDLDQGLDAPQANR